MGWLGRLVTAMDHVQRGQHAIEFAMVECYESAARGQSSDTGTEQSPDDGWLLLYVMLVCAFHC
jgi:hypothetical protein